MWYPLVELLTDDEYNLLQAKLESGRIAQRIVRDQIYDLVDDLVEDYPYRERDAIKNFHSLLEWKIATTYDKGIWRASDTANKHDATMKEILSILRE